MVTFSYEYSYKCFLTDSPDQNTRLLFMQNVEAEMHIFGMFFPH